MEQILFSTTILAAFLGGVVALMAPCCVSVMLPAFFASSFRSRTQILGMTLVFSAGIATIILPIALGAALVSRILFQYHFGIFSVVGLLMVGVGVATLLGWKLMLPMPSGRGGGTGIGSVYSLGVFSGAASACCAPVLAGVAALSGAASSIPAAAVVGVAYVFGMVAPLTVLALVWDKKDWGSSRVMSASVPLWPGSGKRMPLVTLVSGGLMVAMGAITIALAVQGPGMAPDGWQVEVAAALGHSAALILQFLSFVPGWITSVAVFAALVLLIWLALASRARASRPSTESAPAASQSAPEHTHTQTNTRTNTKESE